MEELKIKNSYLLTALAKLPKIRRTPFLTDAIAFAALLGGGYAAIWFMELLFRLAGVA